MKRFLHFISDKYLSRRLDFRVRLFNVLAMAGMVTCLFASATVIINKESLPSLTVNFVGFPISLLLMEYARRTGRYQRCYTLTVLFVFFLIFPMIFFFGGGYHGAMPSFFIFAVLFTIFMLDGKKALIIAALELVTYIGLCVYAYHNPEAVTPLAADFIIMTDTVTGFSLASIVLGICMYIHFRMYHEQQKQLAAQNAELDRINRQKAALLADVSHEIRTPLTVMSGYAQRARKQIAAGAVNEETLQGLLTIQLETQRLAELADRLIRTPMVEQEYTRPGPVRPVDIMEQAAALVRPILDKRGNRLVLSVADECPAVHVSAGMIAQVLVNLCVNANRHTENGEIVMEAKSALDGMAEFAVTDNGGGIAPALLPELFERGVSGDGKSGLGLSICREVVEGHGGKIAIVSQPGKGTRVTFILPQESLYTEGEA